MNRYLLATAAISALCLASCALPEVKLATPEPVKVDINVRLDVYQHGEKDKSPPAPKATTGDSDAGSDAPVALDQRRRNRMGDIQLFKNSRIVGENRVGLLEVRTLPPGEYGDYVKQIVEDENTDRLSLMKQQSEEQGIPLDTIQADRAKLWRSQAFSGEWVEEPSAGGTGYQWVQKGAAP